MGTEIVPVGSIEIQPLSALQVRQQVNLVQEVMREVMKEGQHYGKIPGCGDKPTLLKPGAEKLCLTFRLRPIINDDRDIQVIELGDGHREVRVRCHIYTASGIELATGTGSCSTMESKYRYRGGEKTSTGQAVPKEYWNLKHAGKRDEAQAAIGGPGYGVGKFEGKWEVCEIGEKMENPDIADTWHTVLKMGKKRAFVDGILNATAASDIFTQDLEDMGGHTQQAEEAEKKPPIQRPQAKNGKPATPSVIAPEDPKADTGNPISEPQRKRLWAILKSEQSMHTEDDLKAYLAERYGITRTEDIQRPDYEAICNWIIGKSNETNA